MDENNTWDDWRRGTSVQREAIDPALIDELPSGYQSFRKPMLRSLLKDGKRPFFRVQASSFPSISIILGVKCPPARVSSLATAGFF